MMIRPLAAFLFWFAPPAGAVPVYVTNQSAALAVGQSNLAFSGPNGTPGVAATAFNGPGGVWTDGTRLVVADTNNHRVLIFNNLPTSNGAAADVVLGQQDPASNSPNQGGPPGPGTLFSPTGVYSDGTALYVADTNNNRILVWLSLAQVINNAQNGPNADLVVGQPDFSSKAANQGGASPADMTLSSPTAVYEDANGNLYVADTNNNRVLIYNGFPAANVNDPDASVVVGQSTMSAAGANQGLGRSSATTLSGPAGIYSDSARLFIADRNNNRVLIYNAVPSVNNSSASVVVGQIFMSSSSANQGRAQGPLSTTLSGPAGVFSDGTRLFIADRGNSRVLLYNATPASNGASAGSVLGQAGMTFGAANKGKPNPAADTLSFPRSVFSDGTALYVADTGNNRALIYNPPFATNESAAIVAGQGTMTSGLPNGASIAPAANTVNHPGGVSVAGGRLMVSDRLNNRILIYNAIPSASNAAADVVVGQMFMSSGAPNQGLSVSSVSLNGPGGIASDGTKLFVADIGNNRVLIYNSIPAANDAPANVVIGQPSFNRRDANQGGGVIPSSRTLNSPSSVSTDGINLYVSDSGNNRVLIYNPIPTTNNAAAKFVIGQPGFNASAANQGDGARSNTLFNPVGVHSDGTRLYVGDQNNNRVLIYNPIPAVNNAPASVVVGQSTMNAGGFNQGGPPRANTLNRPSGAYFDGTALYVGDTGNNRVLVFNTVPAANNAQASLVLGQSTMSAVSPNQGGSSAANTLSNPAGIKVDSATGNMFISDANNNRILVFQPAAGAGIGAAGGAVTFVPPVGEPVAAQAQIPPGAFAQNVNVTLGSVPGFPAGGSAAAGLTPSGIGVQITLDQPVQPAVSVVLAVSYNPADLPAGMDASKLILASYDPNAGVWAPIKSVSDTANARVIASVGHFSLFQIMAAAPAGDLSNAIAFPNPMRPALGQNVMTFSSLPANARLRIYTLKGVLVKDIAADSTGLAAWDGTNQSGSAAASGVYFVFAQAGGRSATFKAAIQR